MGVRFAALLILAPAAAGAGIVAPNVLRRRHSFAAPHNIPCEEAVTFAGVLEEHPVRFAKMA